MLAIVARIAATLLGQSAVGWIASNLMWIGVGAAILIGSNLITGVWQHMKGYNSAASKCQTNTLRVEIRDLKRDRDIQKDAAAAAAAALAARNDREQELDQKVANYEQELAKRPPDGSCRLVPADFPRRVRGSGDRR